MNELKRLLFVDSESAVVNALDRLQSPAILRALKICDRLVGNLSTCVDLFKCIDRTFSETLSVAEVKEAITDSQKFGVNISVENLCDAYVQYLPNKGLDADNTDPRFIILNDMYLSYDVKDETQGLRCAFLILVKVLQAYSYSLTPSLARRTKFYKDLNTPEKSESISRTQKSTSSDACSDWEIFEFGGKVLTANITGNFYVKPLQLMFIDDPTASPTPENFRRVNVVDSRIKALLEELEMWVEGAALPNLSVLEFVVEEEEVAQPPAQKRCKSTSESGGMQPTDLSGQLASVSSTSGLVAFFGGETGTSTSSCSDAHAGEPCSALAPVPLSEEEFEELIRVGQAMSPEMQRAWMTGNVKF